MIIILGILAWYGIGVLSMLYAKWHVEHKGTDDLRLTYQEVFGLAVTGPIILFLIFYWTVIDRKPQ